MGCIRLRTDTRDDLEDTVPGSVRAEVAGEPTDFPSIIADSSSQYVVAGMVGGACDVKTPITPHACPSSSPLERSGARSATLPTRWSVCRCGTTCFIFWTTSKMRRTAKVLQTSLSAPSLARVPGSSYRSGDAVIDKHQRSARDVLWYVQDMNGGYGGFRRVEADGRDCINPDSI